MISAQKATISGSVIGAFTATKARMRLEIISSGTATTAHSTTSGWALIADSMSPSSMR